MADRRFLPWPLKKKQKTNGITKAVFCMAVYGAQYALYV